MKKLVVLFCLMFLPGLVLGQYQTFVISNCYTTGENGSVVRARAGLEKKVKQQAIAQAGEIISTKSTTKTQITNTTQSINYKDETIIESQGRIKTVQNSGTEKNSVVNNGGIECCATYTVSIDTGAVFAYYRKLEAERVAAEKARLVEESKRIAAENALKGAQKELVDAKAEVAKLETEVAKNKRDYESVDAQYKQAEVAVSSAKGADAIIAAAENLKKIEQAHTQKQTEYNSSVVKLDAAKQRAIAAQNNLNRLTGQSTTLSYSSTTAPTRTSGVYQFNGIDVELVKAGRFAMGATNGEGGNTNEFPRHTVDITKDFYIGKYEVTNQQYADFLNVRRVGLDGKWNGYTLVEESAGSYNWGLTHTGARWKPVAGYENYPVICVTWFGANEFCKYYGGSLPTEAQWEFAARGGNPGVENGNIYSGSRIVGNVAWYSQNSGNKTHAVGTKSANELGIHDMSGNVREWCGDWNGGYGSDSQTNPTGATTGTYRMYRGGSWGDGATDCRVAIRGLSSPTHSFFFCGFRVAFPSN